MDVILLENVANLGKVGEMVKVKPGQARNYLIPRKLAIIATPKNLKQFQHQKKIVAQKIAKQRREALDLAKQLEAESFTIQRMSQDEEKLYGSVTSRDIEEVLQSAGYQIDRKYIMLEKPIKKPDMYIVPVRLFQDVVVNIKLWVVTN